MRWVWALLLVPLAFAGVPELGVEPAAPFPTTMYVHLNGQQDAPINTQAPMPGFQTENLALLQHSQSCVHVPGATFLEGNAHTWYGFSSPGVVEYDVPEGGQPRIHMERGLASDAYLSPNSTIDLWWYLAPGASFDATGATDIIPQVVLRATLRHGDEISVGATAYNEGRLIGQAMTAPADLHPLLLGDHPQVHHENVDGQDIYGFNLQVPVQTPYIPADEGFNLRIDAYIAAPGCAPEDQLMLHARPYTDAAHLPRFTWSVENPLTIDHVTMQRTDDDLVVHASITSPWGGYDLQGASDSLAGPRLLGFGPTPPDFVEVSRVTHLNEHNARYARPVDMTWAWEDIQAEDGTYRVRVEAATDQGATAATTAGFTIGNGELTQWTVCQATQCTHLVPEPEGQSTPGPALGLLLIGLAALAMRRT